MYAVPDQGSARRSWIRKSAQSAFSSPSTDGDWSSQIDVQESWQRQLSMRRQQQILEHEGEDDAPSTSRQQINESEEIEQEVIDSTQSNIGPSYPKDVSQMFPLQPFVLAPQHSNGETSRAGSTSNPGGHERMYSIAASSKPELSPSGNRDITPTELFYGKISTGGPAAHLSPVDEEPDREEEVINMPSEPVQTLKKVHFKDLFRFVTGKDKIGLALSVFCAICGGGFIPIMPIIFSRFASSFLQAGTNAKPVNQVLVAYTLYFIYLAAAEFVVIFLATAGFTRVGERITRCIREAYFEALLRQDKEYFDKVGAGEITGRLTDDINIIQKGISEKIARSLHAASTFIVAFTIAFVLCYKLAAESSYSYNPRILQSDAVALSIAQSDRCGNPMDN